MKKKKVLFLIFLSMALSIMMCSCGGGDGGIDISGYWTVYRSIKNSTCGVAPEVGGPHLNAMIEQDGANVTMEISISCRGVSTFHGTLSGETLQVSKSGSGNYSASINATVRQDGKTMSGTFTESGVDCTSSSFIAQWMCCDSPESSDCTYEGTLSASKPEFDFPLSDERL